MSGSRFGGFLLPIPANVKLYESPRKAWGLPEEFKQFYTGLNFMMTDTIMSVPGGYLAEGEYAMGATSSREFIDKIYKDYRNVQTEFYSAQTAKSKAINAYEYMSAAMHVISFAHYFGEKFQRPLLDIYYRDWPLIAEALLEFPATFDGVE